MNIHYFLPPNVGDPHRRIRVEKWDSGPLVPSGTSYSPTIMREKICVRSLITQLSGAPRFPRRFNALLLSSFSTTCEATESFPSYPTPLASHAPNSEALQINTGKWGSRTSAACWCWMSLCFLQVTVKMMTTENQPGLDTEWRRGTKVNTAKIPIVLQHLLFCDPPPWSWMKRFCRKPPMIPNTFFLPLLLGHPGQWCWEYYRRKEQCPGPSHKHLYILHLKEMRSISLDLHLLPWDQTQTDSASPPTFFTLKHG